MTYRAPIKDMLFTMQELAGIDAVAALPDFADAGIDTAQAVLEECAKHIARYKLPKAFLFRDEIVRSPSGKADYRWAKQQAVE